MVDQLSKKRGDRVKALLKERGIKQTALAKELDDMNPVVLNDKLAGRKSLTEYNLQDISRILDVRIEYLMLYDNDPTPSHKILRIVQQAQHEGDLLITGLSSFASLNGYTINASPLSGEVEDVVRSLRHAYSIEKDGKIVSLSVGEMNLLENEINDLVASRLDYLFRWKEANNG